MAYLMKSDYNEITDIVKVPIETIPRYWHRLTLWKNFRKFKYYVREI